MSARSEVDEQRQSAFGDHRLALATVPIPAERALIEPILAQRHFSGFEAVEEARDLGLLRRVTRQAELSPTFTCPEDCGGCPDRASLHLDDPAETQIDEAAWLRTVERLVNLGVEYFLLIGGTIDRQSVTSKLMKYILSKPLPVDVGWFTDGIMLQNPHTGAPTPLLQRLIREGDMLEATTHVSADYLVPEGIAPGGPILNPKKRWENEYGGSRWYKSAFGLRLARRLIGMNAKRVVINTAISAHNKDQVTPIYNHVANLQDYAHAAGSRTVVLHTVSPWVWRPHLERGDDSRNYDVSTLLTHEHRDTLQMISDLILRHTQWRLQKGQPRIIGNSSGFIAGLPYFAIDQDVPYREGSGVFTVQPDGVVRMDPIFTTARVFEHAHSPYGFRDRDIEANPFRGWNIASGIDIVFPNIIQSTRGTANWR